MVVNGVPKDVKEFLINNCRYTEDMIKARSEWLKDKAEFIRKYGICPVYLQYIEPYERFVEIFGEPQKYLFDDEPEWKFVIATMMSQEYGKRADWDIIAAVREYVQNALDGAEEVGKSVDDVVIEYKDGYLLVENPSKKLLVKHLELGGSEKPCWSRGRFGEGLNVAGSWIVDTGGTVYIKSHDVAYRLISVEGRLMILVADIPNIGAKTQTIIFHPKAKDMLKVIDRILPRSEPIYVVYSASLECPNDMPNRILVKTEDEAVVYHRNMFVNYTKVLYGKDAVYDYDLWWFNVVRDRSRLASAWEFRNNVRDVLSEVAEKLKIEFQNIGWNLPNDSIKNTKEYQIFKGIIDKCLTTVRSSNGVYFLFEGDFLELDAIENMMSSDINVFTHVLLNEIAQYISEDALSRVGSAVGVSAARVRDYLYMGYVPIIFTNRNPSTITTLESIDTMIIDQHRRTAKSVQDVAIPLSEYHKLLQKLLLEVGSDGIYILNTLYNYASVVANAIMVGEYDLKKTFYLANFNEANVKKSTIAFYDPTSDKIFFGYDRVIKYVKKYGDPDLTFDIVFEEAVHKLSGASDNTAEFEKALIYYSRNLAQRVLSGYSAQYYNASNGLFFDVFDQINRIQLTLSPLNDIWSDVFGVSAIPYVAIYEYKVPIALNSYQATSSMDEAFYMPNIRYSPIAFIVVKDRSIEITFVTDNKYDDIRIIDPYFRYVINKDKSELNTLVRNLESILEDEIKEAEAKGHDYYYLIFDLDSYVIYKKGKLIRG